MKQHNPNFPIFKVDLRDDSVLEIIKGKRVSSKSEKLDFTYVLVACPNPDQATKLAYDHLFGNRRTSEDPIFHSMVQQFEDGVGANIIPVITKAGYTKETFSYCSGCYNVFYTNFHNMCPKCIEIEKEAQRQYAILDKEAGLK